MLADDENLGLNGNVVMDASATVGKGCKIGPDVAIGAGCVISLHLPPSPSISLHLPSSSYVHAGASLRTACGSRGAYCSTGAPCARIRGDSAFFGDGDVNIIDVTALKGIVEDKACPLHSDACPTIDDDDLCQADVNCDGAIDIADIVVTIHNIENDIK